MLVVAHRPRNVTVPAQDQLRLAALLCHGTPLADCDSFLEQVELPAPRARASTSGRLAGRARPGWDQYHPQEGPDHAA